MSVAQWLEKQQPIWQRMKADPTPPMPEWGSLVSGHPWYQQIIKNTTWDRYADQGRWEMLRGLIDGDNVWLRKSFEELRGTLSLNDAKDDFANIYGGNEAREMTIDIAMMYHVLLPVMSAADEAALRGWLIKVCDRIVGKPDSGNAYGTRFGDSDQTTGSYFGLALTDQVLGTNYLDGTLDNSQQGDNINLGQGSNVPVGGLRATGANYQTMRNTVNRFNTKLAKGGYWIEAAGGYNEGTVGLEASGAAYVGMEHFPDVQQFLKENARYLMHYATPDMKDFFEEGDVEHAHDIHIQLFYALGDLLSYLQGVIDDPDICAMVRQFEDDIYAANNYTVSPLMARYFFHANPYGARKPWREWAGDFLICEGQGHVFWRSGTKATHIHFPSNMEVDHSQSYAHGDLMVRKGEKWLVDRPLGYAVEQRFANTVLVGANIGPGYQAGNGLVRAEHIPGQLGYAMGGWAGLAQYSYAGAYGQIPTFNHGTIRHLFELLDGPETIQLVIDVIHAEAPMDILLSTPDGPVTWDKSYLYEYQQIGIRQVPEGKLWVWHGPSEPVVAGGKVTWPDLKLQQVFPSNPKVEIVDEKLDTTMGGYIYPEARQWAARITQAEKKDFHVVITALSDSEAVSYAKVEVGELIGVTVSRAGRPDVTLLVSNKPGPTLVTDYEDTGHAHARLDIPKLPLVIAARSVTAPLTVPFPGTAYVADAGDKLVTFVNAQPTGDAMKTLADVEQACLGIDAGITQVSGQMITLVEEVKQLRAGVVGGPLVTQAQLDAVVARLEALTVRLQSVIPSA